MNNDINIYDEEVGLLKRGTIIGYDSVKCTLKVQLNNAPAIKGQNLPVDVPAPYSMYYNNGLFIGTYPDLGTPIVVGQGSGGEYLFVSYLAEDLPSVPLLTSGELLIRSNNSTKISLDINNRITIGSDINKIHANANSNLLTINFYNENHFTQAARRVDGIVKRDLSPNKYFDQNSKLENDDYDSKFKIIGMDPTVTPNDIITGSTKNPPLVERRELVYEFQYISNIEDDLTESNHYGTSKSTTSDFNFPNRRESRADTLSLTLASPNYLMETIKGTVVDIFGNILDLNRSPLPIGQGQNTIRADKSTDKSQSFLLIKELERKSLAYHFEINARKDLTGDNGQISLPDINSNADYAKNRSRFFLDIDKEGQFKLNVPASSEKGNIPLLTRYENYSTFGTEDNGNINKLIFRDDGLDIFQDSFAAPATTPTDSGFNYAVERGSIQIKNGDADGAPVDRITDAHIKHGTAYHDILKTCYVHQVRDFINYQAGTSENITVDINAIPILEKIVSDTINISGDNANAGGRSGSLSFDGMMEINIGANTIDRQSLWADLAGGIVTNIGRDLQKKSAAINLNGDVFIQIGGFGVVGDSRFIKENNGNMGAVLDLRIFTDGGYTHMVRCDKNGITIMTPGNLAVHSKGNMKLSSDANIEIDCETLIVQQRMVSKVFGGSI